jgi:hypothetical protein
MNNNNIVQQVQAWYSEREEYLSKVCIKKQIAWTEPDGQDGEIGIGLDAPMLALSISVFNNGHIVTQELNKASKEIVWLDERPLAPDEDLSAILDCYVQRLVPPG